MSSTGAPRPDAAAAPPVSLARLAGLVGAPPPARDVPVSGVTHASIEVRPGDLFVALPGARVHGASFVDDAVSRGAVAVLTDEAGRPDAERADVPLVVVADPRGVLGEVAAEVYGRPAEALLVLGVTGTNGKTTTAHLLHAALEHNGRRAGLVGTIETRVGDDVVPSVRTTPEATDLHALLAAMRSRGATAVAMEASSIAVRMGRLDGLILDVVGFTNLSQDHLDFHSDMDDYFDAKAALFTSTHARRGVVVVEDAAGRALAADAARIPVVTVSTTGDADWRVADIDAGPDGRHSFTVLAPDGQRARLSLGLPGRFNVANAMLAVAMLVEAGIELEPAVQGVASCRAVPGRMESVPTGRSFAALVDYAHTPDAVETLLRDVRATTAGRVVAVLGCGGDRDAAKRPLMGAAGARGADVLVVTDDNPRSEDPAAIRAEVLDGARGVPADERAEVIEVGDRAAAIRAAVGRAAAGDVVVVAGKGHEQGQDVAGVVTPFDDRDVLRAALAESVSAP